MEPKCFGGVVPEQRVVRGVTYEPESAPFTDDIPFVIIIEREEYVGRIAFENGKIYVSGVMYPRENETRE